MRPPATPSDAPGPSASRARDLKPLRALGRGRFGDVHLVRDAATDELYALKTVAKSKQLRNEAEVLKKLRHTNVVAFVDAWEDHASDHVLMLMEYADRGDLARLLQTRWEELQPTLMLPEVEVMQWFVQIARGLAHIHSLSVLHRDLKPENIFVCSPHAAAAAAADGGSASPLAPPILKIGDFGIARDMGTSGELASTCVGSPCYLSPELIGGSGYSYKSDVWALGVVAYRCACNRYPFDASNLAQLALKISAGSFAPLPPTYSPLFHHLVASALQMEANVRPSVDDLLGHPRVRALDDEAAAAGASGGIATAIPSIAMAAAAAAAQLAAERTHSVPLRRRSIGDAAAVATAAAAATAAADAAAAAAKAAALSDDDAALPADANSANADGWRSESSPSLRFESVRNRREDMLPPAKAGATRVSALGSEETGTALIGRLGLTVDQRPSAVDPRPPMLSVGSCRGSFYSSTTSTGEPSPRHLAGLSVSHGGLTQSPKLLCDDEAPAPLSPLSPTGCGSSSDSIAPPTSRSTERRGPRRWPSGGGGMMQPQPGGASPGVWRVASRADTSSFRSVNSRAERGGSPAGDAAAAGAGGSDGGGSCSGGSSRGARSPWSTARLLLGRGLLQQNAFDAASAGVGDDGASRLYLALNDLSSPGNSDLELDEEEAAAAAIAVLAVRSRRASRAISEAEAAAAVSSLSVSSDSTV